MACADSTDYGGDNAGDILACGLIFIVAALFRFYVISFMVDDVKMVQSVYFYGSLMLMYAICVAWLEVVFQGYNGNIGASGSKFMTVILSIVDPNFGFAAFVLFKRNFLGATSMHHGIEWIVVPGIIISFLISFLLFLVIECGNDIEAVMSYMWHSLFGGERQQDEANTRKSMFQGDTNEDDMEFSDDSRTATGREVKPERRLRAKGQMDPDIVAEKQRVDTVAQRRVPSKSEHAIFIQGMAKVFPGRGTVPTKVAVDNVSVAIGVGEVFGLLGANGAGKTTLLKIVSGLELPTAGKAYINGYNVVKNRTQAQRSMGLCPQVISYTISGVIDFMFIGML